MPTSPALILAMAVCAAGLLWRIHRWFRSDWTAEEARTVYGERTAVVLERMAPPGPRRPWTLAAAFLGDVLLQRPLWRQDRIRWAAHMGICYGFVLLIGLHALDDWTAPVLFADYVPTRNPFRWLRNGLAALVLAGVAVSAVRHRVGPGWKGRHARADRLFLALLAIIILSGILLESAQIVSPTLYEEMVADYMGLEDPAEVAALGHYWSDAFGAVPPKTHLEAGVFDPAAGPGIHESYCADCHSPPQAAFLSYPLSRLLKPVAVSLDALALDRWLWQLHFLASCLALAWLPFSKGFHLVATPANLLARAAGPVAAQPPAQQAFRRALGMDACTHCGVCSRHCAVGPHYRLMANRAILPSEKLQRLKRRLSGRLTDDQTARLAEGSFICTLCGRCTARCPSGIDLQDLWHASRRELIRQGFGPFGSHPASRAKGRPPAAAFDDPAPLSLGLTERPETFWACVQCTTCTSVCPVVAASDDPRRDLDLTPQQIMNLMRLQLKEQALHCRMLWDCVTCYKCQEHCPQDVKVADVLYELRNLAWQHRPPARHRQVRETAIAQSGASAVSTPRRDIHDA